MYKNCLKLRFEELLKNSFNKYNNKCLSNWKPILAINGVNYCTKQSPKQTHFGFEKVSTEEKFERVNKVFENVAQNYDLMNDVMSFGIHRVWKRELIRRLNPYCGTRLLDTAGGTGDIAFEFIKFIKQNNDNQSKVVVCDINPNMLRVGQNRAQQLGVDTIEWVLGDATHLPFEDESFDAYTIAFGIRNVVHIDQALTEAFRVLRKGAVFLCLEFSQFRNPLLESFYNWYSFQIIPVLGEVLAKDWNSYQYLVESIRQFPDQQDFKAMIESAGFTLVDYTNLMQGIAAIHVGYKK